MNNESRITDELNLVTVRKVSENYVFIFRDENRAELLRLLGYFASNPELSFTWFDAAHVDAALQNIDKIEAEDVEETARSLLHTRLNETQDKHGHIRCVKITRDFENVPY